MNVDRLPESDNDPRPAADTTHLTEPPQPDNPAPEPEPDQHRTVYRQPPPERQPERDPKPGREPEPERAQLPDSRRTTTQANSRAIRGNSSEPAEPRTRQEQADRTIYSPAGQTERQGKATTETSSNEGSGTQYGEAANLHRGSPYDDSLEAEGKKAEAARPRTQQERAEHISGVFARLDKADAEGASTNELHTIDPKGEIWSTDRTLLHHSLLDEIYARAADVPCDHEAIVAGGLSGAGKTTVLANHPEIDRSKYLTINPDNLKEEMARHGMIPEVEGLSPMEASELVHEESSYLARQLAIRAQAEGKNLIWDITMSDQAKTEQRIMDLREAGYTKIQALFVQIPIETSLKRTEARYWENQEKWLAGEGLGGRLIPPEVILRQADEEWGSGNRKTFEAIKGIADNWEIRDNSVDDRAAALIDRGNHEEATSSNQREQRS
jgi:predicted ABC-type ATPase